MFLRIVGYTVSAKLGALPAFKETFPWSPILVSLVEIFNCHLASFNVRLVITHLYCSKEQPSMGGPMCVCLRDMSYSSGVTSHNNANFLSFFSPTYMEIPSSNNQQLLWFKDCDALSNYAQYTHTSCCAQGSFSRDLKEQC